MPPNKRFFVEQLRNHFVESLSVACRAEHDARDAARTIATESEKKEDGRVALEFGSLANGQALRTRRTQEELELLTSFAERGIPSYSQGAPIGLGALIDVLVDGPSGSEERTVILLPVGAGTELTGPGGDGFISVITPASPVGKSLLGKRAGDSIELSIAGDWREWTIVDVC